MNNEKIEQIKIEIRYSERLEKIKQTLIDVLKKYNITNDKACKYANNYAESFLKNRAWVKGSLEDLENIAINFDINKSIIMLLEEINKSISPDVLNWAECTKLAIYSEEYSPQEIEQLNEDIEAFNELQIISDKNKEYTITNEQKEYIQVLTEGLDPSNFRNIKPLVTKEEIELFRTIGKKFNLPEDVIAEHIQLKTAGTPTSYVQNLISRQNIIDERNNKSLKAIQEGADKVFKLKTKKEKKDGTKYFNNR